MIDLISMVILIVFCIINGGLLYYFISKYQETHLRTSLYWVLTYAFFVLTLLISIFLGFGNTNLEEIVQLQLPWVNLGLTALTLSAISTGIFGELSNVGEVIIGFLGIVAFVLFLTGTDSIASLIFIFISILAVVLYGYLAYTSSNFRIAIISIALLVQAVSGRLGVQNIISTNTQLTINSIAQIAIAVGLLGIGLRRQE